MTHHPLIWPDAALEAQMRADSQIVWDSIGLSPPADRIPRHIDALLDRVRTLEKEREELAGALLAFEDAEYQWRHYSLMHSPGSRHAAKLGEVAEQARKVLQKLEGSSP